MRPAPQLWKVSVTCKPDLAPAIETAFEDEAISTSVLCPPRKPTATVEALFDHEPDKALLHARVALVAALLKKQAPKVVLEPVGNLDWLKKVAQDFPPLSIGRWTVFGAMHKKAVNGQRFTLQIDATSAFGTGEHPTTRGCLLMLGRVLKRVQDNTLRQMLDMGCGSGILAMAYAQATRGKAVAVDLDPDSVEIAQGNVKANGLGSFVQIAQSRGYTASIVKDHAPYDLIMANIFARPLCEMAKDLRRHLRDGGLAILSGLLNQQANAVLAAHRQQGMFLVERMTLGEWSVLLLRKPPRR